MNIDNLTTWMTIWAAGTVAVMIAISICKGCCIAKLLGKPCPSK
jgi:hypothetical protein